MFTQTDFPAWGKVKGDRGGMVQPRGEEASLDEVDDPSRGGLPSRRPM